MKKFLILSVLATCSCSIINGNEFDAATVYTPPAKKVKKELVLNEQCEDIPAVKIFQVLDKFALADACETNEYDKDLTCFGLTVYVPKKEGKIYYDDQIIKPSKKQCISFEGTYQYEAGRGEFKRMKTVPVLKIINKYKQ